MSRWLGYSLIASVALGGAASAAQPSASKQQAAAPADKLRCKRYTETGSLAKTRKECHTEAEWQQLALAGRENAREMVRQGASLGQPPH